MDDFWPRKYKKNKLRNFEGFINKIFKLKCPAIDAIMSDCQMGARKKKGCKNNIFIINGIIHDVLKSKKNNPVLL